MSLTLQEKIDKIHAIDDQLALALKDLVDPSTGEAIEDGTSVVDATSGVQYANKNGKLSFAKVRVLTRTTPAKG